MAASSSGVRPASTQDAAACLAIYRPYVQNTAISWEIDVPTVGEMAARIDGLRATHEWLVLERDAQIIGFAYGQPLKRLIALQWSAETGIYVHDHHHRAGAGRELCTQLLRRLTERGYRRAFAGITQPNEASNGFHRSFGFQDAGLTPAARKDRLARSGDPRRASDGPLRNRQCSMPLTDGFAKLEPWTRRPPAVRPDP
jgi:L-amino acid N-acyltransferase YncA